MKVSKKVAKTPAKTVKDVQAEVKKIESKDKVEVKDTKKGINNNKKVAKTTAQIVKNTKVEEKKLESKAKKTYNKVVAKTEDIIKDQKTTDFFDKVNDFGKSIGKTVKETYKKVAGKTEEIIDDTKLKIKITSKEGDIVDIYKEIGQKVYEQYEKGKKVGENEEACSSIKAIKNEIKKLEKELNK